MPTTLEKPTALERLREIRSAKPASAERLCDLPDEAQIDIPEAYTEYTQYSKPKIKAIETPGVEEVEPLWNQSASDVLDIVARAGEPIPHPQIVLAMARREYSKKSAYAAIAFCQERGWIEHNLVSGYVLSGSTASEKASRR